ncbi:nucleotidyltransferase family protein [Tellurirhabdus rosea]|uniref:nucleotidyltransferase family protein n=1 Tax=Tellurirhabdus rosea TaxID=2674997 RepID=UPI00224FA7C7|nr:nucleotidyltransferase domain-containing protein [Tellurirhabdus rosea]
MIPQQHLVSQFFQTQPVRRAYLFGSQARSEATPESDIDILVELDKEADLFQFADMMIGLQNLLNKKVDLVSAEGLSPYIKPYIDRDKILIHEKKAE